MTESPKITIPLALLGLMVLLAGGILIAQRGGEVTSDARHFQSIALNLAAGRGYVDSETFWPDQPTAQRAPGWPLLLAMVFKLLPGVAPDPLQRGLALALHGLGALLIGALTAQLWRRRWAAVGASAVAGLHPVGLHLAWQGLSEPLFVVLTAAGLLVFLRRPPHAAGGWFLLGLACLERVNFILFFVFIPFLMIRSGVGRELSGVRSQESGVRSQESGVRSQESEENRNPDPEGERRGGGRWKRHLAWAAMGLSMLLFLLPLGIWVTRNAVVTGRFPVLSTLRGQTFYGGNNSVVARDFKYWGYWIFPNAIPGEVPLVELAQTHNEAEVDTYYWEKGWAFLGDHPGLIPKLALGKMIRAYVPVPWRWSRAALAASAVRVVILVLAVWGLIRGWRASPAGWRILLTGMFVVNLVTVLLFWGNARFSYVWEVFLVPFIFALFSRDAKIMGVGSSAGGSRG